MHGKLQKPRTDVKPHAINLFREREDNINLAPPHSLFSILLLFCYRLPKQLSYHQPSSVETDPKQHKTPECPVNRRKTRVRPPLTTRAPHIANEPIRCRRWCRRNSRLRRRRRDRYPRKHCFGTPPFPSAHAPLYTTRSYINNTRASAKV
jgi:hypothetical protein